MKRIEKILNKTTSLKITKRTLAISRKQLYVLKDEQGQIANIKDEVIKVVEEFYRKLHSSNDR